MKLKFTIMGMLSMLNVLSFGQAQRFMVAEAFSNASCGPCAQQNPNYHNLLKNNEDKVVGIKYQTNFPGTDPMNAANPQQVATRASYYSINGVPTGHLDGVRFAGPNYLGALANLNQTTLDTRHAIPSPFEIDLTHTMNANYDSIFITVTITAAQDANFTGPLVAQVVLIESEINYPTAPGSNGERNFFNVMRRMYPSANGTTLPLTWINGQTETLTFAEPLPSFIKNLSQVATVAFVQDNSDRDIKQGAFSPAVPLANDGTISALSGFNILTCETDINVTATLRNTGSNDLTSCKIYYQVDNLTPQFIEWTGNLATNATVNISLPTISTTFGNHTFRAWVEEPNGAPMVNVNSNSLTTVFNIVAPASNNPITQTFEGVFPPQNWIVNNPNTLGWSRHAVGGFGQSGNSARAFFWNMPPGQTCDMFTPQINLAAHPDPKLKFNVAYTFWSANNPENDRLQIAISTNCGQTFTTIFEKGGTNLNTAPPVGSNNNPFVPSASQWRAEEVDLSAYANVTSALFRFRGISAFGDNLYVDDINITSFSSVTELNMFAEMSQIFPNPAKDVLNVQFAASENSVYEVSITDMLGRRIISENRAFNHSLNFFTMNIHNLKQGVYHLNIRGKTQVETFKFIVVE